MNPTYINIIEVIFYNIYIVTHSLTLNEITSNYVCHHPNNNSRKDFFGKILLNAFHMSLYVVYALLHCTTTCTSYLNECFTCNVMMISVANYTKKQKNCPKLIFLVEVCLFFHLGNHYKRKAGNTDNI